MKDGGFEDGEKLEYYKHLATHSIQPGMVIVMKDLKSEGIPKETTIAETHESRE